jgi:NitT/TauT family transport system permease protein
MRRVTLYRVLVIVAAVLLLELLCLTGVIDRLTMPPPHRILRDLAVLLVSGSFNAAIAKTLTNASIAFGLALIVGVATAVALHGYRGVRETLDPLFATYYAVPIFSFYPLLIVLLGLGDAPQIGIGFMLGVVAIIVNTLNGLDRVPQVLRKTARIQRLGLIEAARSVTLPCAAPYVLTGAKFAVAYSLIGVIGAEFIMSRGGMGYEISFAYTNFDNATMYPLILLILVVSISINAVLSWWEKVLLARRGL